MTLDCPAPPTPVCPLTGGPMVRWLRVPCDWRRPDVPGAYDLFWSPAARFGQLHPRPSRAEVASFYDVDYYTHGEHEPAASSHPRTFWGRLREHLAWRADYGTDITAERLAALVAGRSPAVLEIGCGDGKLLAALREMGWAGVGIEPDPAARRVAHARGLEVHDGTAEEPPPEVGDRVFDVVVLQHVLEHCLDPLEALRVAAAYLKPNGIAVVEVPNTEALGCRDAGPAWPWLDVPRHLNFFTAHSLQRACLTAGLTPGATEHTGYARQFQRSWLEMEQRIRDALPVLDSEPRPDLDARAWGLLVRTAFARPRYKYDSVRVLARKVV